MKRSRQGHSTGKTVVVIGLGNIGGNHAEHLGRIPGVSHVKLFDPDVYESRNAGSQTMAAADAGRPKVDVQAERLRRTNPNLEVSAYRCRAEEAPLGWLRGDVILACVDSREARRSINEASWRLGVTWIDSGVDAAGWLARVNVYVPGESTPCLECAWGDRDYENLEQRYACRGGARRTVPTDAPSALGALAASLQALECRKILEGRLADAAVGRQILIDAAHHRHFVTSFRRNPACRFDHATWRIAPLRRTAGDMRLRDAFELGGRRLRTHGRTGVRVEGDVFIRRLTCQGCGATRAVLHLQRRLPAGQAKCRACGRGMVTAGAFMVDTLAADQVPADDLKRPLAALGIQPGDVLTLSAGDQSVHVEVGGDVK